MKGFYYCLTPKKVKKEFGVSFGEKSLFWLRCQKKHKSKKYEVSPFKSDARRRSYDHNFQRFLPFFCEKIGVFLQNQCYDPNFTKKHSSTLNKKRQFYRKCFGRKCFKIITSVPSPFRSCSVSAHLLSLFSGEPSPSMIRACSP
jgi:hypothetical protein